MNLMNDENANQEGMSASVKDHYIALALRIVSNLVKSGYLDTETQPSLSLDGIHSAVENVYGTLLSSCTLDIDGE